VTRKELGLPDDWETIASWLDETKDIPNCVESSSESFVLKNTEIPVLENYAENPDLQFWKCFPTNYPTGLCKKVNTEKFEGYVNKHWEKWVLPKKKVALDALRNLKGKNEVKFVKRLGPLSESNARSAIKNGRYITDSIVNWVKAGFVAGPYTKNPFPLFRVNPLMAAEQKTKVRLIMNLAAPQDGSFNDAVDVCTIRKLTMSSAKLFAESVRKCGKGATFAKTDIKDAYKLVPNPVSQWNLYGFSWLGKKFFDTTTVFGSKVAPASFDCVAETVVNIVCSETGVEKGLIHRQLDDVPVISEKGSVKTELFTAKYHEVCQNLNIPLAEDCPNHEKAFGPSTYGTVLGIQFDTENMEWSVAKAKCEALQIELDNFIGKNICSLKDVQKLHGKLANMAQMGEFMKGFRYNLLGLMGKFEGKDDIRKLIGTEVKQDLWIMKKFINAAQGGLPLGEGRENPPIKVVVYTSDAAGASLIWENGKSTNISVEGERGVASVRYRNGQLKRAIVLKWPGKLITGWKSRTGKHFGTKSSTLEAVGLLLPICTEPWKLTGRHVVLEVDNIAVVYGWERKHNKNDPETSVLLRCLHVLESKLSCRIHVQYVRRCSTEAAETADKLTREETTDRELERKLCQVGKNVPAGALTRWLEEPLVDWSLPEKLCRDVDKLLQNK
jgi:hypothetical protein